MKAKEVLNWTQKLRPFSNRFSIYCLDSGTVTIEGNSEGMGAKVRIPTRNAEAIVPSVLDRKEVVAMLKALGNEDVSFFQDGEGKPVAYNDTTKFKLEADGGFYSGFPEMLAPVTMRIDSAELLKVTRLVSPSASRDDTRPQLNGVWFDFADAPVVRAVTTDGYEMATLPLHTVLLYPENLAEPLPDGINIPSGALDPIAKVMAEFEIDVHVSIVKHPQLNIAVFDGGISAYAHLPAHSFPAWRDVKKNTRLEYECVVNKTDLIKALDLALSKNSVACKLSTSRTEENVVNITANDGAIRKTIPTEVLTARDVSMGTLCFSFDPTRVKGIAQRLQGAEVRIQWLDKNSVFRISCEDYPLSFIVMPMRTAHDEED